MAPDHLLRDGADHVGEGEAAGLARDLRVEHDLEKQVAQLVAEVARGAALDRVGDFVGFFENVGHEAGVGLGEIPGASVSGRPELGHDRDQGLDVGRRRHGSARGQGKKKRA